jgi:hypothetical protein
MRLTLALMAILLISLPACSRLRSSSSKQAIRQAIEAHLRQDRHLSLQNFTTEIASVKFKGATAEALVRFRSKQSPQVAVLVRYELKKSGDHWLVTSSAPAGGQGMGMHGSPASGTAPSAPAAPPPAGPLQPEASH